MHAPHPEGTRHAAMIKIAFSLLGNGMAKQAVFAQLRSQFPPEKTNAEIAGVLDWCEAQHPTPSGFKKNNQPYVPQPKPKPVIDSKRSKDSTKLVEWLLNGRKTTMEEFSARSPVKLSSSPEDAVAAFTALYAPSEYVNIITKYTLNDKGKANPSGSGKSLPRDEWIEWFKSKGIPASAAGAWIRMNPCLQEGTGKDGAIKDCDVTAYRFMLIESDSLPVELQISLYAVLKLPVAALIVSGAKSIHAWIKLDAPDSESYDTSVLRILTAMAPFGFDQSNKNPSRLSRLPGAFRVIGAVKDGFQELFYLNPEPEPWDEDAALRFESTLSRPLPSKRPLKELTEQSAIRYKDLYENRGKLGVQVGIEELDRDIGGFKKGQMTVIAAGTNVGKTTTALNFINGAMKKGNGTALFTMEMDREEIYDLLTVMNCKVDRNVFNTGFFHTDDVAKITANAKTMSDLPLWIYDDAGMTVTQIEAAITQLVSENLIKLAVIDYIQIVTPENDRDTREEQVAKIARSIRKLAKRIKIPFIVLSQVNDEGKLRESRVVAHEAHNVMLLEPEGQQLHLKVIKGRGIRKKTYMLNYEPEYCLITSPPIIPTHYD